MDTGGAVSATWSRVEDGFYVGSREGNFLGYIEERTGTVFTVFDPTSKLVGEFVTLPDAMDALTAPRSEKERSL